MVDAEIREPTFLVLASLADGRKHGYALIKEAAEMSDQRVQLKVGTLYAALDRLTQSGFVQAAGEEVVNGRLRRYFELTPDGAEVLEREAARLESNVREARARLQKRFATTATTTRTAEASA
jgi:PadR family transcriptional regulator PadR